MRTTSVLAAMSIASSGRRDVLMRYTRRRHRRETSVPATGASNRLRRLRFAERARYDRCCDARDRLVLVQVWQRRCDNPRRGAMRGRADLRQYRRRPRQRLLCPTALFSDGALSMTSWRDVWRVTMLCGCESSESASMGRAIALGSTRWCFGSVAERRRASFAIVVRKRRTGIGTDG